MWDEVWREVKGSEKGRERATGVSAKPVEPKFLT